MSNDMSSNFQMQRSPTDPTVFVFTPSPEQGSFDANLFNIVVEFDEDTTRAVAVVSKLQIEACVTELPKG